MINSLNIREVTKEMEKLIDAFQDLETRESLHKNYMDSLDKDAEYFPDPYRGGKYTSAIRRQSMELTRALSALRAVR